MKVKRRPMPAPHIPFISLADIAWQIIIFFFMAASFTKLAAMKVDPPSSTAQAREQQQDKTMTVVATAGGLSIDGTDIAMNQLIPEIASRLKDRTKPEQRVVIVEGRKGLTHQRNTEVLYAIKKAGGIPMMAAADDAPDSSAH